MRAQSALPELPDLWAPAGNDRLPLALVDAERSHDWQRVRAELAGVMDGAITDGIYGRQLLQFVLALPSGVDPVFERYRAAAMLDHGDWDGVRSVSPDDPEQEELQGLRAILTASPSTTEIPHTERLHVRRRFEIYEYTAARSTGRMRHWAQRIAGVLPEELWKRPDIAIGRHLRYRQLHDATLMACSESQGGRLEVAHALASEAQRLGDEGEPLNAVAHDIAGLARLGMGDDHAFDLRVPARIAEPTGPSPLGAWEMLLYIMPLLPLRNDDALRWNARLAGQIAARMASPRWQLQSESWHVAADLLAGTPIERTELPGLLARSRRASAGLRALPVYLRGYGFKAIESLSESEALARRSGNLWLQLSCLVWLTALDPTPSSARHLRVLLDVTGWRRPVLVPSEIAADAALGLTAMGERSESILELAITADRPNVTSEVATRYIDDPKTPEKVRRAAVDALGQINTTHAKETLAKLAQRRDDVGKTAAAVRERPGVGLSEREVEVLALAAEGLTNKQIGEKLFLSPHTVARHIANARGKMGAANRTEAAALLRQPVPK